MADISSGLIFKQMLAAFLNTIRFTYWYCKLMYESVYTYILYKIIDIGQCFYNITALTEFIS
jgi:hypothetical protein